MSTPGLPTIWELIAEGSATLPEPFPRAALINWVSARRPDVGVSSIVSHIQLATDNAGSPAPGRTPLLHRVDRGRYARYRAAPSGESADAGARLILIGSSGGTATEPLPAARLFPSPGFARAREAAVRAGLPCFVLSAKHGLLDDDDVVGPFDVQIGDRSAGYRTAWGEWVAAQLGERVRLEGVVVEVHGGVDFAQPLRQPLARRGAAVEIPLPGAWAEPEDADEPRELPLVRTAIGRLRDLVVRPRSDEPGWRASAS